MELITREAWEEGRIPESIKLSENIRDLVDRLNDGLQRDPKGDCFLVRGIEVDLDGVFDDLPTEDEQAKLANIIRKAGWDSISFVLYSDGAVSAILGIDSQELYTTTDDKSLTKIVKDFLKK